MKYRYSARLQESDYSQGMLQGWCGGEGLLPLAGELPATEDWLPPQVISQAAKQVLASESFMAGDMEGQGYRPLREQLCIPLAAAGIDAAPEQLLVMPGPRAALELCMKVLTDPGETVLVERPASAEALQVIRMNNLRAADVACDEEGMLLDAAEQLLKTRKPRLVYVMPDFGSPSSRIWSLERRRGLVELCRRYEVPIIEDGSYRDLLGDSGTSYPALHALAEDKDQVLYTGTYARTWLPGIGAAWIAASPELITVMASVTGEEEQRGHMLHQLLLHQLLMNDVLERHSRERAERFRSRMQLAEQLLRTNGSPGLAWHSRDGGLFMWLELPEGLDGEALQRAALMKGAAIAPGARFYAESPVRSRARLTVAGVNEQQLAAGIEGLVEAVSEFTARS
ncbi:PLP-dependent aminotransferase family protein [Paenibacillus sambharensis]|uniref:PLP-dependent aminotransferase family protein n=1 Tax=Paenibacillus sambharensis TaxID=1803190 RepID=A0A2W1LS72_9BACL|nr:PLP-dependent aminotransferase family protein [Paenibacillus sambharensis]PZD94297.1 PLP-dependent aminotransferase family protein [Paenibacillus sambharensis]